MNATLDLLESTSARLGSTPKKSIILNVTICHFNTTESIILNKRSNILNE